jgi:hypothetical protein
MPQCKIEWINCSGLHTPDTNEAVGIAVYTGSSGVHTWPICADHLRTLHAEQVHHGVCTHHRLSEWKWTYEPYELGGK